MTTLSPETDRLAALIGARTGQSTDEVVRDAVEAHAQRTGIKKHGPLTEIDLEKVRELTRRVASFPLLDHRTTREILDEAWSRE